jgi:hypothetical protein
MFLTHCSFVLKTTIDSWTTRLPRQLRSSIPHSLGCCGSAGPFTLERELSQAIGAMSLSTGPSGYLSEAGLGVVPPFDESNGAVAGVGGVVGDRPCGL